MTSVGGSRRGEAREASGRMAVAAAGLCLGASVLLALLVYWSAQAGWTLPATLAGALILVAMVWLGFKRATAHAHALDRARHDDYAQLAASLRRVESDARLAWRMLKDEHVIDGYALWDKDDTLVDYSGFLGRYLPEVAQWDRPSAVRVVEALVHGGHVAIPDGMPVERLISEMCLMRRSIPGLREMRMRDGRVYQARTVALGDSRHACIFTDVTELRSREEAQRASDALFRTAFDSSPLMMLLLDRDERPIAVNRAFTTTLGYSLETFADLGWNAILDPDDAQDAAPRGAPWLPAVKRIVAADGTAVRGQVRFTPVRDAEGEREGRTLITVEDVTSRWEAEERIRYQASLLDQVTNAVLAVDRSGRVAYGNRAAQALFQWSGQVLPGTPVDKLLGGGVVAALGAEKAELETEGITWAGTRFPAAVTLSRMVDEAGQWLGTVLMVNDLTQRRTLDLQLMHSARLATLGEMSASIAHEFNQCLHVIRLSSEALRMDLDDGRIDVERATKRADNILSQVDRLTDMVMQMRSISRRDSGAKRTFPAQLSLDAATRMVEPMMKADGIQLKRVGSLGTALVAGHQVRLEQVLLNLLNNACDAVRDRAAAGGAKGGTVTLTCETNAATGRLFIRVADDGTGVADDVAAHLFEPFVTTKDENRGCGLGLSISHGIAHEMGGALTFRNLERGAEFTLDLPIAEAVPADPSAPAQPCDATGRPGEDHACDQHDADARDDDVSPFETRRVLLVDDEALSVMMVAEFLERQGYRVDTAYDGVEALGKLEQDVYDVVITDIRMPRMDGRELIRRLEDLQPGTPVIVVTGHLKEGTQADLGANVAAVLAKPFQLLELRQQLARIEADAAAAPAQFIMGE
ncbi:MAG: response regulator [Solirubrobacterales bacterium]